MRQLGRQRPTPLPVQALDHATGYMMAAAAAFGLARRLESGRGCEARASLARTGLLLTRHAASPDAPLRPEQPEDRGDWLEKTVWGPARRLKPPVLVDGAPMRWERAARPIGADEPIWAAV